MDEFLRPGPFVFSTAIDNQNSHQLATIHANSGRSTINRDIEHLVCSCWPHVGTGSLRVAPNVECWIIKSNLCICGKKIGPRFSSIIREFGDILNLLIVFFQWLSLLCFCLEIRSTPPCSGPLDSSASCDTGPHSLWPHSGRELLPASALRRQRQQAQLSNRTVK